MKQPLVFIDTETTGLDPRRRRIWDVGVVVEQGDLIQTHQWFVDVDLRDAEPGGLKVGRYYERHPNAHRKYTPIEVRNLLTEVETVRRLSELLCNATVIGAVPWFDMQTIETLMFHYGLAPNWHYHLVDVETLAAGKLGLKPPWNFDKLLAEFGLVYTEDDRHTALGDALMAFNLYHKVLDA